VTRKTIIDRNELPVQQRRFAVGNCGNQRNPKNENHSTFTEVISSAEPVLVGLKSKSLPLISVYDDIVKKGNIRDF